MQRDILQQLERDDALSVDVVFMGSLSGRPQVVSFVPDDRSSTEAHLLAQI